MVYGYGPKAGKADYLKTQVLSASPAKLTSMLFDGAIKSIKLAQIAIEQHEIEKAHNNIMNAENIIYELANSVDTKVEGELPGQLLSLYDFMNSQLQEDNIKKDKQTLVRVLDMLTTLSNSWKKIDE